MLERHRDPVAPGAALGRADAGHPLGLRGGHRPGHVLARALGLQQRARGRGRQPLRPRQPRLQLQQGPAAGAASPSCRTTRRRATPPSGSCCHDGTPLDQTEGRAELRPHLPAAQRAHRRPARRGPPAPGAQRQRRDRTTEPAAVLRSSSSTGARSPTSRRPIRRIRLFLSAGVLGGTLLALLGGVLLGRRAMLPVARHDQRPRATSSARATRRSRSPSRPPTTRWPSSRARCRRCSTALEAAREETEGALHRQRQFVADASHELRTPLTSILANLELLTDVLDGERGEAARSALRSSQRMRRLVGDLLLLARADANRQQPHEPTDISRVLVEVASELGPVSDGHHLTDRRRRRGRRRRPRRALPHDAQPRRERDPPHARRARTSAPRSAADNGEVVLTVQDDGPGVAPELREQHLRALRPRRGRPRLLQRPRASRSCARWPSRTAAASCSRTPTRARASSCACPAADVPAREPEPVA